MLFPSICIIGIERMYTRRCADKRQCIEIWNVYQEHILMLAGFSQYFSSIVQ